MKACVFTLGCKVNKCESDGITTALIGMGLNVTDQLSFADIYVVNTCAVTNEAESKSRQILARIKAYNSNAKIFIMGCASQNNFEKFYNDNNVINVLGTHKKSQIINYIQGFLNNENIEKKTIFEEETTFDNLPVVTTLKTRTNIKIEDGCNNFCTYCLIPYLRGRCRSRSIENIRTEILSTNSLEVVLDGINISAYNYEGNDLSDLILSLADIDKRIRLGSIEVRVINDKLLTALKNLKNFAPHFHLSLQSGSNKVLQDMNRHYTTEEFFEKVSLIRKYFNNVSITTDIICGFPTESEQNFSETVEFVNKVKFSDVHAFTFSMRKGTKATKYQDIAKNIKKQRTNTLIKIANECRNQFLTDNLQQKLQVIGEVFDGEYTVGYSENYIKVYVKGDYVNKQYFVCCNNLYKDGLKGEIIYG